MSVRLFGNLQQRKSSRSATTTRTTATNNTPKEELMVIAQRSGWTPRSTLTMAEIKRMGALEFRYHELFSPDAVATALAEQGAQKIDSPESTLTYEQIQRMSAQEAHAAMLRDPKGWKDAFDEEERRRQSKVHVAKTKVELCWSGHSTPDEDDAAYRAGNEFALRTPSFPRTQEAATLVADFMKQNLLDGTRVDSYVKAFRQLVEDRKIQPLPYQSADEFLKNNPQLVDQRKPPLIEAKEARAQATAAFAAKTEAASAKAGSTTVVDYENEHSGYPAAPTKYSFRRLLDSLSADEFQRRLNEDGTFAAAIDKLNNGNK